MNARWETIDRVFHAALERPPAERAAFVRRELPDPDLAGDVLSLLESGGDEEVPRQPLHLHGLMDALGSAFLSGTKIGPYIAGDLLGEGGMGLVYRAVDERDGSTVAIKVLAPEQTRHPGRVERFLREAKAMAAVSHPAVVRIREAGSAAGLHYLAMEYLDGETLQQRIRRAGALPLDELLACGEAIAGALEAAHSSGVTHRDLKPENVMLTPDGVKVLDFGVAHLDDRDDEQRTTLESALRGTVSYLAPEQIEGAPATAQSDLFSFGVLLWEAAAGQPLFQRANPIATARAILEARPDYRRVPAALRPVLQKCLARDPRRRFRSAGEVCDALRAARRKPAARISKPVAAAVVAVTAGAAWMAWMYFGASAGISQRVVVPSATDIWLAGQPDGASVTGTFGTDTAPAESPVMMRVTAGHTLTFSATGSTTVNGSCWAPGPDGGCYPDESIFGAGPANGMSSFAGPACALLGVFVGDDVPRGRDVPKQLDFKGGLKSQRRFAPELRQIFFIGDGLTGTGSGDVQRFRVPTGATRLFLAVSDSLGGSSPEGNLGQIKVKVTDLDGK
jgi:tRNA A-37 threonylcarbamoyl transferase component Bud32